MDNGFTKKLPFGAAVTTRLTADGDCVPDSVTYPTENGGTRTVRMKLTPDGDRIPVTGHTPDGDYHWPEKKLDW